MDFDKRVEGVVKRFLFLSAIVFFFTVFFTSIVLSDNAPKVNTADNEWVLVTIPDTQHYSGNWTKATAERMRSAFDWLASNVDRLNIKMVQGLGDVVEWDQNWQWMNGYSAWSKLEGKVAYMPVRGNHDNRDSFNKFFPIATFSSKPWFGGYHKGSHNTFFKMTIGNEKYLFLQMDSFDPYSTIDWTAIDWANMIVADHKDYKVILATHDIWSTTHVKNHLILQHGNIIMSNGGHSCVREALYTTHVHGGTSYNFVTDYQCDEKEVMLLRLYVFKPKSNQVCYYTYSPIEDRQEKDPNSKGCFYLHQR